MRSLSRFISFLAIIGFLVGSIPPLMPASHAVAESTASNPLLVEPAALPAISEWPSELLAKIEPFVLKNLKEESARTDVFLWLTEKADLSPAYRLKTKEEKGRFVFETLRATAERTQRDLRAYLDSQQVRYQPFYISNKILVRDADQRLLYSLAARPDVARITANHRYQLEKPRVNPKPVERVTAVEPNISFVNADDVWALGVTGEGIVLAGNDTGLDWQHPAILPHYRGWNGTVADHNYNWWDATDTSPTTPRDMFGHGTHTTGTMVGDDGGTNQTGMAPGAQTIHCKNMDDFGGGWDETFIECFQWDLAPWDLNGQNPRPDLAPDAVNNSWGYWGGGVPQFEDEIAALQAAGILVEVSAGNEGPSCRTLRSPGDYGEVLTTGSVSHASGMLPGSLTWFSSRGPSSLSPDYIPDVMAPGENVRSSVPGGRYENWDGTSMAGPHVTGLIGLIWSANPALRGLVPETQQIIWNTAEPLTGQTGSRCGGDYVEGPNQDWGYGTINALAAVEAAMSFGGVGTLAGTVTDSSTGDPLAGVLIRASLTPELTWKMRTNEQGQYSRLVFSGTYTVTAELYGYYPVLITGVQVISGTTTTLDIVMDPAPFYTVTGQVSDADAGWPLYARLDIAGYPGGPVWTDPQNGQYGISLAAGIPYTFKVSSWVEGYETVSRAVGPLTDDQVEDFVLQADRVACAAPGYSPQFVYFEDFEGDDGGYTVEGYTTSWQWGTPTSGPRRAHSGSNVWATNLTGNYYDGEYGSVSSPEIDLSGLGNGDQFLVVTWWQYLETEEFFDFAWVEVSNDGGNTWTTVYGPESGSIDLVWTKHTIYLDPSYAVANFRIRFVFQSDFSITAPGYYVDDVGIGVTAAPPNLYAEDFEADNGGYTVQGVTSWQWGTPTRGPSGAHSGEKAWGTNLSGNYGNNEDGTLTSPPIDLSGGAQGAESLQLSWWQWLQTESGYDWASVEVSDGLSWTEIISASGIQNTEWTRNVVYLDPARYAVPNFQIRFRLRSDETVTYPGFYVDDVRVDLYTPTPPAVPCLLETGGLVFGHVYAATTGEPLNGATVASRQMMTWSQATPEDEALDDGFYTLFAEPGLQVITATMSGGYGREVKIPTVIPASAIRQDFHLPSGRLTAEPPALQTMLEMGYSTTLTFELKNEGALPAFFELREQAGEFTPARLEAVDVPGYQVPIAPEGFEKSYAGQAAEHLVSRAPWSYRPPAEAPFSSAGVTVLLVAAADVTQIQALLQAYPDLPVVDVFDARMATPTLDQLRAYDAVVLISNFAFADPVAMGDVLADYVDAGGTVVQTVPTFYDASGIGWGVQGRFVDEGYSPFIGTGDWFTWADLGDFDPAHPIMEGVGSAGDYFRQMVDLAPEAEWVASWADDEFVATKDAVVALNTFLADGYAWSGDIPLIVHNSLIWLQTTGDVPWLSLMPITGTVASLGSQPIQVTFDAGVPEIVQPGQYTAQIRIKDDTPHQADPVQVAMTVGAPAGWGKLTGTITGLERCDAPGGPLPTATVDIEGVAAIQPEGDGVYGYWLPAGPYTVTVSAPGYVSETFLASVLAGQTITHDVTLRLDAPCTSPPATALSVTLFQGWTMTESLTLENTGAADLSFVFFESPFQLGATAGSALLRARQQAFRLSPRQGPASVLSLASPAEGVSPPPGETPLSGWFGALDVPGGLVRYGFAQCPEYPDQYYVLSGVDASFSLTKKAWRYDAATNDWTELASLPSGGEAPAAVCYQGRIYVMGGSGTDQFYVYDIATNRWAPLAPLPRGVEGAAAAAWDGKVYLVGGDDDFMPSTGVSDQVDIYDIATDTWIGTGTPMPIASANAGWAQVGPVLYIVGGWGVEAPASNIRATQRYNLESDIWELGPDFSGRADFALAATDQALYAMGGDKDGGGFFDAVRLVERLDLSAWPDGAWADMGDPLPIGLSANNAGFCTRVLMDGDTVEIWSVGGGDAAGVITGRTLFREMPGESCPSTYLDVPWLSVDPPVGTVPISGSLPVTVLLHAGGLMTGTYTMTLVLHTNDPGYYLIHIPVTMRVVPLRTYYLPLVTKGFSP